MLNSLCVFLSANEVPNPVYHEAVLLLGEYLATHQIRLVYGGSSTGLMGALARTVLENNGLVTGVFPRSLANKESAYPQLDTLITVEDISERLKIMITLSDAFLVMPGGLGTLEECLRVWNELRLGLLSKPMAIYNLNGLYSPFVAFIKELAREQFVPEQALKAPIIDHHLPSLLQKLQLHGSLSRTIEEELLN